jgi:hypothetical protein
MPDRYADDARPVLAAAIRAHRREPLAGVLGPQGLGGYRGYGEVLEAIDAVVARGARVVQVGESVRGEPLFALRLGAERPLARTAVSLSAVHPLEWIGVEAHLATLERLAGEDLGDRALVAFPLVNPDGLLRVEMNLRAGRRRFVRHNARGVDLNRNFEAHWYERGLVQRLFSFVFASGSRPASEPEVAAIAHALSGRRVDRAVSLHSFGGTVLYPSAASLLPVLDAAEHRTWARYIARRADPRPYRVLPASWFSLGFTAGGLELDWFHERHGALSLLVECSRGGLGLRPSRLLQPFAWFNPPDVERVARPLAEAIAPFVRGVEIA